MSAGWAVLLIVAIETMCGLGVLAVLGLAHSWPELGRRAGLAPLAGMAWTGLVAATLATAGSRLSVAGLLASTFATCAWGAIRLRFGRTSTDVSESRRTGGLDRVLEGASLATIAILGAIALAAFHDKPLAEYDGWAIWGMKAKAIAALGSADTAVFAGAAYERLHPEYPLLLPALNALPLQAADGYSSNTVVLHCLAMGVAGLLGLWTVLRDRVHPVVALAFLAAIAGMPAFFRQLSTGYADVPLALFIGVGVAAAARWLLGSSGGWLAVATLFLAAATITKNEGLLFAASAYAALFLAARGRRRAVAVSGALVAATHTPWWLYTRSHGLKTPDYDLGSSFDVTWIVHRLDRAPVAARELAEQALQPRQFGLVALVGTLAVVLCLSFRPRPLGLFAAGFALLSVAGLTWIYVLTTYDLSFYLSTNSDRVVMSPVIGLAALAPLLVEETVRTGSGIAEASSGTPASLDVR